MDFKEATEMTLEDLEKANDKWMEDHFKYGFYMPTYEERKAKAEEKNKIRKTLSKKGWENLSESLMIILMAI